MGEQSVSRTLVYEVLRQSQARKAKANLLTAIDSRLNSIKSGRATVQLVGQNSITVGVAASTSGELSEATIAVKRRMSSLAGKLEFRILANRHDHEALIARAETERKAGTGSNVDRVLEKA
jgi:hypothetical protein